MTVPKVKVALITGQKEIRTKSEASIAAFAGKDTNPLINGLSITCTTDKIIPSKRTKWLWCGKYFSISEATDLQEKLEAVGVESSILPVGLMPDLDSWKPREFRLLVSCEDGGDHTVDIAAKVKDILPDIEPVTVEIPEKNLQPISIRNETGDSAGTSGIVYLKSNQPIKITDVLVGEGFHWAHAEDLDFNDPLWINVGSDGKICGGVEIDIEDYLASVNSSEMPAESPIEFLKAQVVAARSWLLANWGSHHPGEPYTICAGDHCQCYYGPSRVREASRMAVENTAGEALVFDNRICDARYAKTCGGVTEPAANVWPFADEPYLGHYRDLPDGDLLDLSNEERFREFQDSNEFEHSCCAPGYTRLGGRLSDLAELYRWRQEYTAEQLSDIIQDKTGTDAGKIMQIDCIKRGPSGRLIKVRIIGSKNSIELKPELEIRRLLSPTHLPSSAFWIERGDNGEFIFHGLGWGHGVGMCQMGAVSLASRGYNYRQILEHYYPNTSMQKIY